MLFPTVTVLFGSLFVFCGAMFLIHSVSTGAVNENAAGREGAANGLYISSYYTGGVLGSYAAGLIHDAFGWETVTLVSILLVAVGATLSVSAAVVSEARPLRG